MARRGLNSNSISPSVARRIALHAQGFSTQTRDKPANWAAMAKAVASLQLLQIDSVNVLVRSHYLPLYSRLGNYDTATLDNRSFSNSNRHFFECWAHEASLVPLSLHPLMRWRMERARRGNGTYRGMNQFGQQEKAFLKSTLDFVRHNGPSRAAEIPDSGKAKGGWWGWSRGKLAMETLFDQGLLTAATRQGFERIYDFPERVLPADILNEPTPSEPETMRRLVEKSAEALGIGTEQDLRDYFRLPVAECKIAIAECVESGLLLPMKVEGWKQQAYLHAKAKWPAKAGANALLTPFDPVVWNRERAERLFDFHYRIELYTPAAKRKFGYYVLPFLSGEKLSGRVCLKADRHANTLRVNASHMEAGCDKDETSTPLAAELQLMARWLKLGNITVASAGNLASVLKKKLS